MPSGLYYLNGPTLSTATSVFTNQDLTTLAPDSVYSDNTVSREQVSGLLQPPIACPVCAEDCGFNVQTEFLGSGLYSILVELGATTGAVIIDFKPGGYSKGFEVTYDSVIYNAVSSDVHYFLQGTANLPTWLGTTGLACVVNGGTYPFQGYKLLNGVFVVNGGVTNVGVTTGQIEFNATDQGNCCMVIPKTGASPTTMLIKVYSACGNGNFEIDVACPVRLTAHGLSGRYGTQLLACASLDAPTNRHIAPNDGNFGNGCFVYTDEGATTTLASVSAAGFYKIIGSPYAFNWYEIDANSVIIDSGVC